MKAKSVIDVILGEAKAGSYEDMLAIASVIHNRSTGAKSSYEDVVSRTSEFNAYGKALPSGVNNHRSLAEKALNQVQNSGPVHNATFYATPKAQKYLPKGLSKTNQTDGHVYFTDPQKRPIYTASGLKQIDYSAIGSSPKAQTPQALSFPTGENAPIPAQRPAAQAIQNQLTDAPRGLAALNPSAHSYANQGKIRDQNITPELKSELQAAAEFVYGPGSKAVTYSGGQAKKGTSSKRTGSTRHDEGNASDTYFYNSEGDRLRGDSLAPMAQHWLANNKGGVGLEMSGGGIHLDTHKERAKTWAYGGGLNSTQSKAVQAGLRGEQSPMAASVVPTPMTREQASSQTYAAPRGVVERGGNLPAPIDQDTNLYGASPSDYVNYQSSNRSSAMPRGDVAPRPAATPQAAKPSYRSMDSVANQQMAARPVESVMPTAPAPTSAYTPKASDYANYMMGVPASNMPTGTDIPIPEAAPMGIMDAIEAGPQELIPELTPVQKAKRKAVSKVKNHFAPKTMAARAVGGLLGGPLGAMAGPKVAQFLNNRTPLNKENIMNGFGGMLNRQPVNTFQSQGNNSSNRMQSAMTGPRGASNTASNGSQATSLGNGQYTYYSPKSGKTSVKGEIDMNQSADLSSFFGN